MSKISIGIEIDDRTVKLLQCAAGGIKSAAIANLPEDLVQNGKILSMDAMGDFIRATAKENGFPTSGAAAVVLPGSAVYARNLTVPAMTDQQVKYSLPFEFKDYLAEEKGKYYFDYAVIDTRHVKPEDAEAAGANGGQGEEVVEMDLFACATQRATIDGYRSMLRRAGYKLKAAVPEEYALSSVLRTKFGSEWDGIKCYCIAFVGYRETNLFFFCGTRYSFRRAIDFGVYDIESKVSEIRDVDLQMAHQYVASNFENVLGDERVLELYDSLAVEIMKAINFFNYNNRDMQLDDLYMCGGGLTVGRFSEAVTNMTRLTVHLGDELLPGGSHPERPWMYLYAYGCML